MLLNVNLLAELAILPKHDDKASLKSVFIASFNVLWTKVYKSAKTVIFAIFGKIET